MGRSLFWAATTVSLRNIAFALLNKLLSKLFVSHSRICSFDKTRMERFQEQGHGLSSPSVRAEGRVVEVQR